jgi:hypothetical protein
MMMRRFPESLFETVNLPSVLAGNGARRRRCSPWSHGGKFAEAAHGERHANKNAADESEVAHVAVPLLGMNFGR